MQYDEKKEFLRLLMKAWTSNPTANAYDLINSAIYNQDKNFKRHNTKYYAMHEINSAMRKQYDR